MDKTGEFLLSLHNQAPKFRAPRPSWVVTSLVGVAGSFRTRAAARELVKTIKASGITPARLRIERKGGI